MQPPHRPILVSNRLPIVVTQPADTLSMSLQFGAALTQPMLMSMLGHLILVP